MLIASFIPRQLLWRGRKDASEGDLIIVVDFWSFIIIISEKFLCNSY